MLIECILKRKNGTVVELDDKKYHFKPTDTDERHLAEVLKQDHAQRFLSISEGYRYAGEGQAPVAQQSASVTVDYGMPRTSKTHAAVMELATGKSITLPELTIAAFKESGLSITEWNDQDDEDLYEQLDATLAELQVEAESEGTRRPPERGTIPQPEPEEGLGDEDDDLEEEDEGGDSNGDGDDTNQNGTSDTGTDATDSTGSRNEGSAGTSDGGEQPAKAATIPSHEVLVEQYKQKMGRAPSSRLSDERIFQLLNDEND